MKNLNHQKIIAGILVAALELAQMNSAQAKQTKCTQLTYSNLAYVHAIHDAPNPEAERIMIEPQMVYVDQANGQAIYSYPGNNATRQSDLVLEYVNTGNGQAIHGYANNN